MSWVSAGKPGDIVVCPRGHEIADVVQVFGPKDTLSPKFFDNWRGQRAPVTGEAVSGCPICGQHYMGTVIERALPNQNDQRKTVQRGILILLRQQIPEGEPN